ncbi:Uncharacterised protein [Chlamydia trachomatis]|nr:Uncharacterised protein [Chlamydia trachomatis]
MLQGHPSTRPAIPPCTALQEAEAPAEYRRPHASPRSSSTGRKSTCPHRGHSRDPQSEPQCPEQDALKSSRKNAGRRELQPNPIGPRGSQRPKHYPASSPSSEHSKSDPRYAPSDSTLNPQTRRPAQSRDPDSEPALLQCHEADDPTRTSQASRVPETA